MSSLFTECKHPSATHIFTDGSYRPDGNASCAYLIWNERNKTIVTMSKWAHRGSTINQMELMAINHALDCPNTNYVIIYSDSSYAISCLSIWRKTWAKNNWLTPLGEPVKNRDLIIEIGAKLDTRKYVRWVKVKAHSGNVYNSTVDYLAQELSKKMRDNPSLPDGEYPV
jgi:ribonuclease HI